MNLLHFLSFFLFSELSVLDILGDSEPDANNSVESLPEAHVAFSVEGWFYCLVVCSVRYWNPSLKFEFKKAQVKEASS